MADITELNMKMDKDLKYEADKLFNEMGMNLATAITVFVRQAVLERAIPFKINRGVLNTDKIGSIEQRRAAMQEIRNILADIDGSNINLKQMKEERRAVKFENTN